MFNHAVIPPLRRAVFEIAPIVISTNCTILMKKGQHRVFEFLHIWLTISQKFGVGALETYYRLCKRVLEDGEYRIIVYYVFKTITTYWYNIKKILSIWLNMICRKARKYLIFYTLTHRNIPEVKEIWQCKTRTFRRISPCLTHSGNSF